MASLNVKSFTQLVQDQAAAVQTKAKALVDFSVGSILRAVSESVAALGLWLQGLVLQVLALTRLATSTGTDVDTWVNDWGVTRLAATLAAGSVTFSRYVPTNSALIPLGAQVQTADGTQTFQVVLDATNSAWSSSQNGYLLPANVSSVTVPVQAVTGSVSGNVVAGAVNTMTTAIVGVDYVSNANPFTGGSDAEGDAALRARFVLFIASLSKGTVAAIEYAVSSLQLGLQCTVLENVNFDGSANPGYLTVTVDDGTGAPPNSILTTAAAAVGATRAGGIMWGVFAPIVLTADIAIVLSTKPGYDHNSVVAIVAAAVTSFVNTLPLGQSLYFLQLAQVIYGASPGVAAITSMSMNNASADIIATLQNVVKIDSLVVS